MRHAISSLKCSEDDLLSSFAGIQEERARRNKQPPLAKACHWVKSYQELRFRHTYADLLQAGRFQAPAVFFLEELYGPQDFTERDRQFERVIPALMRLFPQNIIDTVACLVELHALSEELDSWMGRALCEEGPFQLELASLPDITAGQQAAQLYQRAWIHTGRRADREKQLVLTLQLGRRLDRLTRISLLRMTLKMMRGPARRAGLDSLQCMLERGFDTFHSMGGAEEFLELVSSRESGLLQALFSGDDVLAGSQLPH